MLICFQAFMMLLGSPSIFAQTGESELQPESLSPSETSLEPGDEKAAPLAVPAILGVMAQGCLTGVSTEILYKTLVISLGAEETLSEGDLVLACVLGSVSGGVLSAGRAGVAVVRTGVQFSPTLARVASQATGVDKAAFGILAGVGKKYSTATLLSWIETDCDLYPANLFWDDLLDFGFWQVQSVCIADSLYRHLIGIAEINVESAQLSEPSDPVRPVGFQIREAGRMASIVRPGVSLTLGVVVVADPGTYTFRLGVVDSGGSDHLLSQETVTISEEGFQDFSLNISSTNLAALSPSSPAMFDLFFEASDGGSLDLRWEGDPPTSVSVADAGQTPPVPMLSVETNGLGVHFQGRVEDVDGDVIEDLTLEITSSTGTELVNVLPAAVQVSPTEWEFDAWDYDLGLDFNAGLYDVVLSVSNAFHLRRTAPTSLRLTSGPMAVDLELLASTVSQAEPFEATCEVTDELGPVGGVDVGLHNDGNVHYRDSNGDLVRKVRTDAAGIARFTVIPQQAGTRTILCMSPDKTFDFGDVEVIGSSADWQLGCDLNPEEIGEDFGRFIFQCRPLFQGEQLSVGTEVTFSASLGTIEPDDQVGASGYAQVNYELQATQPTSVVFTLGVPSYGATDLRWIRTVPIGLPDSFEPTGTLNRVSNPNEQESMGIAFSQDKLAFFPSERTVWILEYPSLTTLHSVPWNGDDLNACAFSADGSQLACVDSDGTVFLIDPATGAVGNQRNVTNDHTSALSISWCGDNQHFVVGTEAGSATYPLDAQMVLMNGSLSIVRRIKPSGLEETDFMRVACSAATGLIAGNTWFSIPTTVVHDWNGNQKFRRDHPDFNALWALAMDRTGEWMAFGGDDNNGFYWLHLYRWQQGQWVEQPTPGTANYRIHAVGFAEHPDEGQLLVVGGTDALELFRMGEVVPWRAHSPDPLAGHKRNRQIHWFESRDELVSASNDQQYVYPLVPDFEAPEISLNAESPVPFETSSVEISGTVTDASNLVRFELSVGGGAPVDVPIVDGTFSVVVELQVGINSLGLEAEDEFQNVASVPFDILRQQDNSAPTVSCAVLPPSGPAGTIFDLSCWVADNDAVALVELGLDGSTDRTELTVNGGSVAATIDSSGWSSGDHTAEVRAIDPTGNIGEASVTMTIEMPTEGHLDLFDTVGSYSGDDGDRPWPGPWRETPADGGSAGWGHVRVITDGDVDFGISQLRIRRDGMWVERPVDGSGAGAVTWRFDYRRESLLDGHFVAAEVSADGSSWTEVARMAGPADDTDYLSMEVEIPTDSAWIRFANPAGLGMGNGNMVFFDNVELVFNLGASMKATVSAFPNTVVTPGGPVTFSLGVENTSPSGSLDLDTLDYSLAGGPAASVHGSGTCLLPQSIAVGETYTCELDLSVMGSAGTASAFVLSASGSVGGESVSAAADVDVNVIEDVEANAKDAFHSLSYSGSDGTVPWASDWIESPVDGSQAGWGDVRIIEDTVVPHPQGPYQAFMRDDQLWLRRKVDLTGFSAAELVFDYRRDNLQPGQRMDIEVSTDGVTFERLASIEGSASGTDLAYLRWSPPLDLSPYIGPSMWIQFSNLEDLGMGNSNAVYFDNVEIRLQSGSSIAVGLTAEPTTVVEPSGPVTFEVTVTNHSPSGQVTLTDLVDDQLGSLDGLGSCVLPQSVAASASYVCSYGHTVSGSAGSVVTHQVNATATAGSEILSANSSAEVLLEAPGLETLRDEFNAIDFHGHDGTLPWSSPWIESVSDGGAAYYGHVRVEQDPVGSGPYALRIRRDGLEVRRGANLTGFGRATLNFKYRRNNFQSGHRAEVDVSLDGTSWTTLDALAGPALDLTYQTATYDLTPWIGPSTWIRFHVPSGLGMGNEHLIYFDDIEIQLTEPLDSGLIENPGSPFGGGNLLRNPGFDEGLGYWQLTSPELTSPESPGIVPSSQDAQSRASASLGTWGSARISSATGEGRFALSQCVGVEAGRAYVHGSQIRVESASELDPSVSIVTEYFEDDRCEGAVLASEGELLWLGPTENTWQRAAGTRTTVPTTATSARVWLVVQGEGHGGFRAWLDAVSFRRIRLER